MAHAGAEENNNRFRLEYVNKLGIPWNILIFLGKKNIGKTYSIHRLIDECIEQDRWIVLIRMTAAEIQKALCPIFNDDYRSKVKIVHKGSGQFDILQIPPQVEDEHGRTIPKHR